MTAASWEGEPHVLVVTAVEPPDGPLDDGRLGHAIRHPASCRKAAYSMGNVTWQDWDCELAHIAREGLAFSLRYSGTPVTEPGTYVIRMWSAMHYSGAYGSYEYDCGIAVTEG